MCVCVCVCVCVFLCFSASVSLAVTSIASGLSLAPWHGRLELVQVRVERGGGSLHNGRLWHGSGKHHLQTVVL